MPSSISDEPRESIRFAGRVGADSTETLTVEMEEPATVEEVRVRFYSGPRLDLHIYPFAAPDKGAGEDRIPLVNFPEDELAKSYIDGEDDLFTFDVTEPVQMGDTVGVEVENTNSVFAYDYTVDVVVDFEGGSSRALFDRLRGWL